MTASGVTVSATIRPPSGRAAVAAASLLLLAGVAVDVRAQGGTLDAPMHPIGKSDGTPTRCAKCPSTAQSENLESQRAAERSAPEYPGVREPETVPSEVIGVGLSGGQISITLSLR